MKMQRRQGTHLGVWWFVLPAGMGTRSKAAREAGLM